MNADKILQGCGECIYDFETWNETNKKRLFKFCPSCKASASQRLADCKEFQHHYGELMFIMEDSIMPITQARCERILEKYIKEISTLEKAGIK